MPFAHGPSSSGSGPFSPSPQHSAGPVPPCDSVDGQGCSRCLLPSRPLSGRTLRGDEPPLTENAHRRSIFPHRRHSVVRRGLSRCRGLRIGQRCDSRTFAQESGNQARHVRRSERGQCEGPTPQGHQRKDAEGDEPQIAFETAKGSSSAAVRRLAMSKSRSPNFPPPIKSGPKRFSTRQATSGACQHSPSRWFPTSTCISSGTGHRRVGLARHEHLETQAPRGFSHGVTKGYRGRDHRADWNWCIGDWGGTASSNRGVVRGGSTKHPCCQAIQAPAPCW